MSRTITFFAPSVAVLLGLAGCFGESEVGPTPTPLSDSYTLPGNPECSDLGLFEFHKFDEDDVTTGYFEKDGYRVDIEVDGLTFDWTSTLGMDAVIVKGGPNAQVYPYDEAFGDEGLVAPDNPNNDDTYGLSHITFCFDYELHVEKNATTTFNRTYTWTIDKTGATDSLTLSAWQSYTMDYEVVLDADYEDSDFAVSGTILVHNPAPVAAIVTGVEDTMTAEGEDPIDADVDCGDVTFPYELAAGESFSCAYSAALPDATERLNEATATTAEGPVDDGTGTAEVTFGEPTESIDECVELNDSLVDIAAIVCADQLPFTHAYQYEIVAGECDSSSTVRNVATIETTDTGATAADDWTVEVTVPPCDYGCSLTPGYWKTHSEYGPAPYDKAWGEMPQGADTPFFLSGQSYYHVIWTAPRGNAYYILSHAYIAAVLNGLNEADTSAVTAELERATEIFETYTPAQIEAMRKSSQLVREIKSLAKTLDDYNNGLIGPGHCDE